MPKAESQHECKKCFDTGCRCGGIGLSCYGCCDCAAGLRLTEGTGKSVILVVMQSEEFGREIFPRETWEEAITTIKHLTATVIESDDGIERVIGVLLNSE